jgi:hypothetical protein
MRKFSHFRLNLQLTSLLVLTILAILVGCSGNDPFDPNSLENRLPVVSMAMTPVDSAIVLNPTSYFNRTFHWSGTDVDGWVVEYHLSIRTDSTVPAPWDTTARTDTTMSFVTDASGHAEATFLLACRDNRGAMSDTLVQYIPFKNFPPAVNFKSDFDPLRNMQRELRDINGDITDNPSDAVDTTYWNWGASNFRFFALDLDGQETMDPYYRYTLKDTAEGDPDITYLAGDPEADPNLGWIQVNFPQTSSEVKEFEIFLNNAPAGGTAVLTVAVNDEANADTRFHFGWEVREPSGPVLYIPDNSGPSTKTFYRDFLAGQYGAGGWNEYSFWYGYPDHSYVLIESMRKFEAVLWADGGSTSPRLEEAAQTGGVLAQYLNPLQGQDPGRLLLVSKGVVGNLSAIPHPFLKNVLGISPSPSPVTEITTVAGKAALGLQDYLPALTSFSGFGKAVGLAQPAENIPKAVPVYQMELCVRCYGLRPPYDPVVGMRFPDYETATLASVVTLSLQLEYFNSGEAMAAMSAILSEELGVGSP